MVFKQYHLLQNEVWTNCQIISTSTFKKRNQIMDPFRLFLVNLSSDLKKEQWKKCAYSYSIPLQRKETIESAADFFFWMVENDLISSSNVEELNKCFKIIARFDLIVKVEQFKNASNTKDAVFRNVHIIPSKEVEKVNKIGQGAYGTVYKAKYKEVYVAAKEINIDIGESAENEFLKEANILRYNLFYKFIILKFLIFDF
jgi:hypothetical protein